jgi:recombination protein RecR
MSKSNLVTGLIDALRCLPGIGPKSAQRIAFHLLERDREGALQLADALLRAAREVGHCTMCHNFSEMEVCAVCASPRRDHGVLCVVASPADIVSIEQSGAYSGMYFVLMGQLSPLDGIGPEELGMDLLGKRISSSGLREVILATGTTLEGEATAHYVAELARAHGVRASRIAYGVPLGGELEYVDGNTLSHAITSRREL